MELVAICDTSGSVIVVGCVILVAVGDTSGSVYVILKTVCAINGVRSMNLHGPEN